MGHFENLSVAASRICGRIPISRRTLLAAIPCLLPFAIAAYIPSAPASVGETNYMRMEAFRMTSEDGPGRKPHILRAQRDDHVWRLATSGPARAGECRIDMVGVAVAAGQIMFRDPDGTREFLLTQDGAGALLTPRGHPSCLPRGFYALMREDGRLASAPDESGTR